jgi:hypothetical protein
MSLLRGPIESASSSCSKPNFSAAANAAAFFFASFSSLAFGGGAAAFGEDKTEAMDCDSDGVAGLDGVDDEDEDEEELKEGDFESKGMELNFTLLGEFGPRLFFFALVVGGGPGQ